MALEAAINQNNLSLFNGNNLNGGNVYLLNQQPQQLIQSLNNPYQQSISTFLPQQSQQMLSPGRDQRINIHSPSNMNNSMHASHFESSLPHMYIQNNSENNAKNKECIYESTDVDDNNLSEQEPMITKHYATSGLLVKQSKKQYLDQENQNLEEHRNLI